MGRFNNAKLFDGRLVSVEWSEEFITDVKEQTQLLAEPDAIDLQGQYLAPGMIDLHVHSRDPGFAHKEDWVTLTRAAHKGGVVMVCDMPNTDPVTMDHASILSKKERADQGGLLYRFYLGVGAGNIDRLAQELTDHDELLCGLKVYYGQSTGELMYDDLNRLAEALPKPFTKILSFHSEDQCAIDAQTAKLLPSLCDDYASFAIHSTIRSSKAAHTSTQTILDWGHETGFPVHIAHLSTPKEMTLIEQARARGQKVTTEVAPHHLVFSIEDYPRLGPLIKMNPPVRTKEEVKELNRQFALGLIECFATDHAPHTLEEKDTKLYKQCPSGVPSIEYFAPLLFTLAKRNGLDLTQAMAMGTSHPAELLGLKDRAQIKKGCYADFTVLTEGDFIIAPNEPILSKCGWTPFRGMELDYRVQSTWFQGKCVYDR